MQQINFDNQKSINTILKDGVLFTNNNFKNIIQLVIKYGIIPFLLTIIAQTWFFNSHYETILSIQQNPESIYGLNIKELIGNVMIVNIIQLILLSVIIVIVYSYMIELRKNKTEDINYNNIIEKVNRNFAAVILFFIISLILISLGFAFFILPGFILIIPISLISIVRVNEEKSFFQSLNRSFKLISGKWHVTLIIILLLFFINLGIGFLFQIPETIFRAMVDIERPSILYFSVFFFIAGIGNVISIILSFSTIGVYYFSLISKEEKYLTNN